MIDAQKLIADIEESQSYLSEEKMDEIDKVNKKTNKHIFWLVMIVMMVCVCYAFTQGIAG
jgi:hypothetical protein